MRFLQCLIIPFPPSLSIFELGRIVFVLSLRLHCFLQVGTRCIVSGACVGVCACVRVIRIEKIEKYLLDYFD